MVGRKPTHTRPFLLAACLFPEFLFGEDEALLGVAEDLHLRFNRYMMEEELGEGTEGKGCQGALPHVKQRTGISMIVDFSLSGCMQKCLVQ
jgi:hypothetical protein